MTMHKLTAGDGYLYLVRQVAAADTTERGRPSLADYYSAKGESPGRWTGRGLAALSQRPATGLFSDADRALWSVEADSVVTEAQMGALFGEGRHPNADAIDRWAADAGMRGRAVGEVSKLGHKFHIRDGEPEFSRRLAVAYREHNAEAGQRWNATIDPGLRAQIRTRLALAMFTEQYGRAPQDDRELAGFIARNTRVRTTAVAGYDLTFSPVKSVSSLWAVAPLEIAAKIEAAHDQAVAQTLEWLQDNAAFTRTGTNGVAQVDTEGFLAAAFIHRDSRAGDPDLHTHVAISNKVCHIGADGTARWLALDGQPLHRVAVAASEFYNCQLEAHLSREIGTRFVSVDKGRGKRPVREIDGFSSELMTRWSTRRALIEARTAELAKAFQTDHGREPTNVEIIALAQQATLESREAKHEPRSLAEQRQTWRTQAIEVLGRRGLSAMMAQVLAPTARKQPPVIDREWIDTQAAAIIATISEPRATWQRHHIRAEAIRVVRGHELAGDTWLIDALTEAALGEAHSVRHATVTDGELGEPAALRRRNGASVYSREGTQTYTSAAILAAERRILAAAGCRDGRVATDDDVQLALADSAARGRELNAGQIALVSEMATCGRRVALALAPAGTGKTTAMAALAHAWRNSGGTVIGLAPTADAAIVLGNNLGTTTDTLDKYAFSADPHKAQCFGVPDWFTDIGPHTLIIVDEAGKASTAGLDAMITHARSRGANVRLIGDDCQLSSVSAGGIVRDLAHVTDALTLTEVVRFRSAAEAAAGLAVHAGDVAGIAFYIDNGRIHVGADQTAEDMAYDAWRADLASGVDSILLAPTNTIVDRLNQRARADRIAATAEAAVGPTITLADGLVASIGDTIRTRKNARWLRIGRTDFVRNGYRYTITAITDTGAICARHMRSGQIVVLPAAYIADNVTLGYAGTIDCAQGTTAGSRSTKGTCHTVGGEQLSRQHLYVGTTRATDENHVYFSTAEADPHRVLSPKATHPDTAVDVLTRVLARDSAQVSATTADRNAHDPALRLHAAADMYYDALGAAAEDLLGDHIRTRLDAIADSVLDGLASCQGWPVLRRHLAIHALDGANPHALLSDALAHGTLADAADPAAVLDYRIDPFGTRASVGPLRWLPAIPAPLAADPQWGAYLARREHLVATLADDLRDRVQGWTTVTAPAWARPLVGVDAALAAEIAVFRAAIGAEDTDTRLTGPRQFAVRAQSFQDLLTQLATSAIGRRSAEHTRWNDLIDSVDDRIRADAYWPQLANHLAQAARSGIDLRAMVTAAAQQGPLPDELPAAALWWRLAGALSPIATLTTPHSRLRPAWISHVADTFGAELAETIISDPAWPALVAAINAANPDTWTPADLLAVAAEQLNDAQTDGGPIPAADYTRLITYTVDAFTHRLRDQHGLSPAPELDEPPLSPEDEESVPPDPHNFAEQYEYSHPQEIDISDANPIFDSDLSNAVELQFEDYTQTRHTPSLKVAENNLESLREEYLRTTESVHTLHADILAGTGPAARAAAPTLLDMRARADADRPHALAVAQIIDAWVDADAAYNTAELDLDHARAALAALQADPAADPLDLASARAQVAFYTEFRPADPSQRFQPALDAAYAARAHAAGGAHNIITEQQIATVRYDAEYADLAALRTQRDHQTRLRSRILHAERDLAAAFAAAQTNRDDHLTAMLTLARQEVELLRAAAHRATDGHRLHIGDTDLERHTPAIAAALQNIADRPFTTTYVRTETDTDAHPALATLRESANRADRRVLWLCTSPTDAQTTAERDQADTVTTIDDACAKLNAGNWELPRGTLVIAEHPAAADPHQLTHLAHACRESGAQLLLVDTGEPGPSQSALRLLESSLPWSTTFSPAAEVTFTSSKTATTTLAARLGHARLSDHWRQLLAAHTSTVEYARSQYQLHIGTSWNRPQVLESPETGLDADIEN